MSGVAALLGSKPWLSLMVRVSHVKIYKPPVKFHKQRTCNAIQACHAWRQGISAVTVMASPIKAGGRAALECRTSTIV